MNYSVFDANTMTITEVDLTLGEAVKSIEHASPYGIVNNSTNRIVCYRTQRGFFLPMRTVKACPVHAERMANISHRWNYNPNE